MDTYLKKGGFFMFKKIISIIVVAVFIFSLTPAPDVSALRNPQPANTARIGNAISEAMAKSMGDLTEQDGAIMIANWANLTTVDRQNVLNHLNTWQKETDIDVRMFYQNMVTPPVITAAEPVGDITEVEGVDLTLSSPHFNEYVQLGKQQVKKGKVKISIAAGGPGARLLLKDNTFPQIIKTLLESKGLLSKPTIPAGPVSGKGCVTFTLENITRIESETDAEIPIIMVVTPETEKQIRDELATNGQLVNLRNSEYRQASVSPVLDENNKIPVTWDDKGKCIAVLQPGGTFDALKPYEDLLNTIADDDTVFVLFGDEPILNDVDFIYSVAGARAKLKADVLVVATPKTSIVQPFGGTVLEAGKKTMIVEVNNRKDVNEKGPYADSTKRTELTRKWANEPGTTKDEIDYKKVILIDPNNPQSITGLNLIEANMLSQGKHLSFNTGVLVFSGSAVKALIALKELFPPRLAKNRQVTIKDNADDPEADTKINIAKSEQYLTDSLGILQDTEKILKMIEIKIQMRILVADVDIERYGATKTWGKVENARTTIASLSKRKAESSNLDISVSPDSTIEIGPQFTGSVGKKIKLIDGTKVYINGNVSIGNNVTFKGPGIVHLIGNVIIGDNVAVITDAHSAIRVVMTPQKGRQLIIDHDSTIDIASNDGKNQVLDIQNNVKAGESIDVESSVSIGKILDADSSKEIGVLPFNATVAAAAGYVDTTETTEITTPTTPTTVTTGIPRQAKALGEAALVIGPDDATRIEMAVKLQTSGRYATVITATDEADAVGQIREIEDQYTVGLVVDCTGSDVNLVNAIGKAIGNAEIPGIKTRAPEEIEAYLQSV